MEKEIIGYIMGFIDAEASFSISIKVQKDLRYGIRIDPVFSITQTMKKPLELIANTINAGRIIRKPGQEHLYLLIIDNIKDLTEKLIPFIEEHKHLLIVKAEQYNLFKEIVVSLNKKEHMNPDKLRELVIKSYMLSSLNPKSKRKRKLEEILTIIDSRIARRRDLPGER